MWPSSPGSSFRPMPKPEPSRGAAAPTARPYATPPDRGAPPALPGPVFVASDVHLGASTPEREKAFVSWLRWAGPQAGALVINGDLFDFWYEYRTAVPRGHIRVLGILQGLADRGLPILVMGGNHDWWGGDFLTQEIGVEFVQDPVRRRLAGWDTLIAHGDGLGKGDLGYRLLRLVLRGRFTRWAFRWLHPDVGAAVAQRVSLTETRHGGPTEEDLGRSRALEAWAVNEMEANPELELVLLGHTHTPNFREVAPGRFYVNTGDWLHHFTFLRLEEGRPPCLYRWKDGEAEEVANGESPAKG